jgi:uncharacterized protein (TIGR01777 family)
MKILISGASGMVGSTLAAALRAEGHAVGRLARPGSAVSKDDVRWDPKGGGLDVAAAEGAEAIVHLAGASIAGARWSTARKQLLRRSRVDATKNLIAGLARMSLPPRIFVCASAVGYYGDRGDEKLTEHSAPGSDFLAELSRDWEAAAREAETLGARTAILRFGIILSKSGGALPRMLSPFRLGAGGRLGSGRQWMSWLTLSDAIGIIRFALTEEKMKGPANAVSPHPASNAEFTRVLGHVLRRPTLFPAPAFALRLALGEMAGALLLGSQRVLPERLTALGYQFSYSELEPALRAVL